MRKKSYRIKQLFSSAGPLIVLSSVAWAEPPDQAGEAWDDSHMRSNFARRIGERTPSRVIVGSDRYGELATGAAAPPTRVQETILSINPHGWTPGGPSAGTSSSTPRWAAAGSEFSAAADAAPRRTSSLGATSTSSASSRHRFGSR